MRILIADDHPLFRDGIRGLLETMPDIIVTGEAANVAEVVKLAAKCQPDVILMDIKMPDGNGIEATRQILTYQPHIGVIMLTMFEDDDSVFAAMRAGARGYLLKDASQEDVLRAIVAVVNGEAIFSPSIAQRMINYFHRPPSIQGIAARAFPELTAREQQVLNLIAQGYSNPEIARELGVSLKTIQNQVSLILNKLQLADRVQAAILARQAGWGQKSCE